MKKILTCINCPRGCQLEVDTDTLTVVGNSCPRGKEYGINEVTNPKRVVTSTVKVKKGELKRCSVKTNLPVPKERIFEVMNEINKVEVTAPINIGQVIIKDVLETGSDVVATKNISKI